MPSRLSRASGGGGGIRTHGHLSMTTVFKTVSIDHSDTPPISRSTVRRFPQNSEAHLATQVEIRSLVEGFLLDCKVTGKSLATISYYTEKLNKFLWYVDTFGLQTSIASITSNNIREFLAYARTTDKERFKQSHRS